MTYFQTITNITFLSAVPRFFWQRSSRTLNAGPGSARRDSLGNENNDIARHISGLPNGDPSRCGMFCHWQMSSAAKVYCVRVSQGGLIGVWQDTAFLWKGGNTVRK
jgi:hypothetical protein